MENFFAKMKEYLHMDTEISFAEFNDYYQQVMDYLKANYETLEKDDSIKAKFILMILASNSAARAQRKGPEMKKYKKINEKTRFWADAINFRLIQSGLSQSEIDQALDEINKAI